jgi:enoyl-CoA hydratase/carnithine racemase
MNRDIDVDFPVSGVACLRIARPARRNALTWDTVRQMRDALARLGERGDIRALVVAGDKAAFCAGADLALFEQMKDFSIRERKAMIDDFMDLALELEEHRLPSIAVVQGSAVGGGMELALACDLIVTTAAAKWGSVFIRHGLMPDMGGTYRLSRRIGAGRTRDLMLTGRIISGLEAGAMGLADRVEDDPERVGVALAAEIAARSPTSVALIRRMIRTNLDSTGPVARFKETLASLVTSGSEEHRSGTWNGRTRADRS